MVYDAIPAQCSVNPSCAFSLSMCHFERSDTERSGVARREKSRLARMEQQRYLTPSLFWY